MGLAVCGIHHQETRAIDSGRYLGRNPMTSVPLVDLGIITLVALVFGIIASRLKQNACLGYILAGVVLGPLVLGYLVPGTGISSVFSDLGLIMILFYLGLELNLRRLREAGAVPFVLGAAHLAIAFFCGFAVSTLFGLPFFAAATAGAMITASSTVMVARFILDRGILKEHHARIALSILVLEDFFGIFVLVFLSSISAQKSLNVFVFNGLLFVIAMFYIVSKVSRQVLNFLHSLGHSDKMVYYAIGIGVISAYVGSVLGLSTTIGAYFAGFALAETVYGDKIKRELGLFREFFLVFFFVTFGSTIFFDTVSSTAIIPTVSTLIPIVALALALSATYVIASLLAFFLVGSVLGLDRYTLAGVSTLMLPLGEFLVIIVTAAQPLLDKTVWVMLVSSGFLMILFTAPIGPMLYDRQNSVADFYFRLMPSKFRGMLSSTGRKLKALEQVMNSPLLEDQYVKSVERMAKNLVIAFSIVYICTLLVDNYASSSSIANLPFSNQVAIGFLLLLVVTWPLYKFVSELRFLVEIISRNLIRLSFPEVARTARLVEDEVAEVITGILLTIIGLASTVGIYYSFPHQPLFTVVPIAYTMLALMGFTKSFSGLVEHFEPLGELSVGEEEEDDSALQGLKLEFEENTRRFNMLHSEREMLKEKVREAIHHGDTMRVRLLLGKFRKKEEQIMRKMVLPSRSASSHLPGMVRPADSKSSIEYYLLRRAKTSPQPPFKRKARK